MDDLISDELEHLAFMQEITELRTRIYSALLTHPSSSDGQAVVNRLAEIQIFGDEPVFTSLVHDRMLAEAGLL